MITTFIVVLAVALAIVFSVAWLLRSDLRERIERPKHEFQDQVRQYDQQCHDDGDKV